MDINRVNSMQISMYRTETVQENATERAKKAKDSNSSAKGDQINVSNNAQLRDLARRTAQESLDIRQEKIDKLKGQLNDGSYEIDVRQLASQLLFEDSAIFKA